MQNSFLMSLLRCSLLAASALIFLKLGFRWIDFCQRWLVELMVLPVPLLGCAAVWLGLSRILLSRISAACAARPWRDLGGAVVVGVLLYAFVAGLGSKASAGRYLVVCGWLGCCGLVCLLAESACRDVRFSGLFSRQWKLRLLAGGLGLTVSLLLLVAAEFVCSRLLAQQPAGPGKVYAGEYLDPGAFFRQDRDLGTALESDRRVACRLSIDEGLVWDVHYSTDQYGRRRSVFPGTQIPSATAVFFGCSFLFGEGAEDSQTIPSKFSSLSSGFLAANYGVPGWGTQHMLALLQSGTLKSQMVAPVKLGVYLYLPEVHEARVVGDMDIINSFGADFPCYELDAAGQPVRLGTFSSARPLTVGLYGLLGKSSTRAILGLNFPRRTARHYLLTAALIERSKDLFLEQFPDSRFLVVAFPDPDPETATLKTVRENGVEVLDLAALFDATDPQYQHVGDGHPTPAANGLVAEAIVRHVQHPE
jgi:hypothetical protein